MLITSAITVSTDEDSNVKEFFYNGLEKTFKENFTLKKYLQDKRVCSYGSICKILSSLQKEIQTFKGKHANSTIILHVKMNSSPQTT